MLRCPRGIPFNYEGNKMGKKEDIKDLIKIIGLFLFIIFFIMIVYYTLTLPQRISEKVVKEEIREVLDGSYSNVEGNDYILLQIKYDDYSKLEKYSIHDIVFKDIEDVEQPYLKVYLNRYDRVLNSELYY